MPDLQALDRIGTAGLAFIVFCLMKGWLRIEREFTQQRGDAERRLADCERHGEELAKMYQERLDTANTAAAEWRSHAYKAMGIVESKQG